MLGDWSCRMLGALVGDVIITRDEIKGLMANLLFVSSAPTGTTKLTDWIGRHSDTLGLRYSSELARRKNRVAGYGSTAVLILEM